MIVRRTNLVQCGSAALWVLYSLTGRISLVPRLIWKREFKTPTSADVKQVFNDEETEFFFLPPQANKTPQQPALSTSLGLYQNGCCCLGLTQTGFRARVCVCAMRQSMLTLEMIAAIFYLLNLRGGEFRRSDRPWHDVLCLRLTRLLKGERLPCTSPCLPQGNMCGPL